MRLLLPLSLLAPLLASESAFACDVAEKLRLTEEQKKLAARNAWSGVERAYEALQLTKCDLGYDNHYLGAESARLLGKVYEQFLRLEQALALAPAWDGPPEQDPKPRIQESLDAIRAAYRKVEIQGDARRRPVLSRPEMPFASDQRSAIEWAQTVVAETGSFKGMLPLGRYVVGDVPFEVEAGDEWMILTVGKVKVSQVAKAVDPDALGGTDTQGAVRYAGLVLTAGAGLLRSPEPATPSTLADGGHQFAPSAIALTGVSARLGGEIGLTYAEPALGIAIVGGYSGGYGTDSFNLVSGWFAGVIRPGDLRVALGPTYQVVVGQGSGVSSWFDRGHDQNVDPNEDIPYRGTSWGPGVEGSVGYGLLDLEPLQGVVELGGAWQSDGARSFFTFGLRVGLVPAVPRFEG